MEKYKVPISLFKQTNFSNTIWWRLKVNISGYQKATGNNLVTEIIKNRIFKVIYPNYYQYKKEISRILVQFFEDGYICWIDLNKLNIENFELGKNSFVISDYSLIQAKIPMIINWIRAQSKLKNKYLWGGTLGPNFDCSGLIQAAFFTQKIYIPRDSYQIKSFCKNLVDFRENQHSLKEGDILFFGTRERCDHVGIYIGNGLYYHSSGIDFGRNGIGIDTLRDTDDKISLHYQSKLVSAGRVIRGYRWDRTIR